MVYLSIILEWCRTYENKCFDRYTLTGYVLFDKPCFRSGVQYGFFRSRQSGRVSESLKIFDDEWTVKTGRSVDAAPAFFAKDDLVNAHVK